KDTKRIFKLLVYSRIKTNSILLNSNSNIPSNILDGIYVFTNLYVNKFSNVYFTSQLGGNHMIYNNDNINNLPVAIIGGGPVGLSAASHLVSRNQPFILFESGEQ